EIVEFKSEKTGYIKVIKALNIGLASMKLGGGRETKDDIIDPMVGIVLAKKIGNHVNSGETLARIYADKPISADIFDSLTEAFDIVDYPITTPPIILEIIR
ncbi:MAG: hypothetical protein WC874_04465, partial [Candidatus Izemoplasmatales bacterium]